MNEVKREWEKITHSPTFIEESKPKNVPNIDDLFQKKLKAI